MREDKHLIFLFVYLANPNFFIFVLGKIPFFAKKNIKFCLKNWNPFLNNKFVFFFFQLISNVFYFFCLLLVDFEAPATLVPPPPRLPEPEP